MLVTPWTSYKYLYLGSTGHPFDLLTTQNPFGHIDLTKFILAHEFFQLLGHPFGHIDLHCH